MYQSHWDLDKPPFPSGLDMRLFYEGVSQRESLARLRFLLAHRRRLGLVLGETGLGKSLLLHIFAEQCQELGHCVAQLDLLGQSPREFYWQLGSELRAAVRIEDDPVRLFRQLTDRLQENRLQGKQTIVVLDDLDQAGPDLLSHVQRLLRTEFAHSGWLSVVASVNPAQLNRVGKPLLELVDLRIEVEPWDELDTIGYVQMALVEAGAERPLFEDAAMSELHRASAGKPRVINRLADFALLAGSSGRQELIDAETIRSANEAISLSSLV